VAKQAKAVLDTDKLEVVADRGYFNGDEILACEQANITVTLSKPLRSGAKAQGRFGKQDFVYLHEQDVYRCPADQQLIYRYTREQDGKNLRLLDQRMFKVPAQIAMYDRSRAASRTMGARARGRGGATTSR
jgi:hypothetical protein